MLLKLEKYYIAESCIKAIEDFPGGEVDFDVEASGELFVNSEDHDNFRIGMSINFQKKKGSKKGAVRYSGKVNLIGYFSLTDSVKDEMKEKLLMTNGMSLLYGAAREHVASITSRGPWDSFYLPCVSFRPDEKSVDEKLKK